MEKKVLYSIQIEGNDHILQEMGKIRKENTGLIKENKEYQKALKDGTKITEEQARSYERNAAQITDNRRKLTELGKEIKSTGGATRGIRDELTKLRRKLQESAEAGDTSSRSFVEMRNRAAELQDNIDRVNAEIKVFADDAMVLNTVVDATKGLASGFQLVQSAQALMGVESERLMEILVKLQAAQGVVNGLQGVSNMLQKESRIVILGKVAAVKIATAAQWLWNKAMLANPIGLIIAAVAALVAGIIVLVKNFDRITNAVKENRKWFLALLGPIGLVIAAIKHFSKESRDARKATRELKDEQDRLIESNEKLIGQYDRRSDFLTHQINIMRALGASTDDLRKKEEDLILTQMNAARVAYENNQLKIESGNLSKKQLKEAKEEAKELLSTYQGIQRQYEIFQAEQTKIDREREEEKQRLLEETAEKERILAEEKRKKQEEERREYIKREQLALAQLNVLREKNLENEINLLEKVRDDKLSNDKLTASERLIIEEKFLKDKENLTLTYLNDEISSVRATLIGSYRDRLDILNQLLDEKKISYQAYQELLTEIHRTEEEKRAEESKRRAEEEKERLQREIDEVMERSERADVDRGSYQEKALLAAEARTKREIEGYKERLNALENLYRQGAISHTEYVNQKLYLNQLIADAEEAMFYQRVDYSFKQTEILLKNLNTLAGGSEKIAAFMKALAIAETVWSISKGFAKTVATGFPQNIPYLIGYAAQVTGLLVKLKSMDVPKAPKILTPRPPRLSDGGIIGGKPHSLGGTIFRGTDGSVFEAEKDEYLAVVNKYDASRAAMLDRVNQTNGKPFSRSPKTYFAPGGIFEPRQDFRENDMSDMIRTVVEEISNIPVVVSERDISTVQRRVTVLERSGNL